MNKVNLAPFFAHLKQKDLARKHLWTVSTDVEELVMYAVSTNWPSKVINPVEVPFLGFKFKVAGVAKFDETWKITVRDTPDFALRKKISLWQDHIYNPKSGKADYVGYGYRDATLMALKPCLEPAVEIKMIGMFPTTLGPIEYDYGSDGEVVTYDVEFAYQRWDIEGQEDVSTQCR